MKIINNGHFGNHKRENSILAQKHIKHMCDTYPEEIDSSIARSVIYGPESVPISEHFESDGPYFHLCPNNHVSFLNDMTLYDDYRICIHNFASYKHPGGGFVTGSMAQEEALCHASILYNVLSSFDDQYYKFNNNYLNRGMYLDRAIYSPDVMFEFKSDNFISSMNIDVLTCAAPNASLMKKYNRFSSAENMEALERRVSFICRILDLQKVHTFITGAWGCGVFKQDPTVVASLLYEHLKRTNIHEVWFVVPRGYNFDKFYEVLRPYII